VEPRSPLGTPRGALAPDRPQRQLALQEEVACLASTAANIKLRHEQFPTPTHAVVLRMIAEGHIDPQFAQGVNFDVSPGNGGGDSGRRLNEDIEEEASSELGTLPTILKKAMTALEWAKEGAGGAEGGGARRTTAASPQPRRSSPPSEYQSP